MLLDYVMFDFYCVGQPVTINNCVSFLTPKVYLSLKKGFPFVPQKGLFICPSKRVFHFSLYFICPSKRAFHLSLKKVISFVPEKGYFI